MSEGIERPVPERAEFASIGLMAARAHRLEGSPYSILTSTFRPASSQSPKNVSVVKSPRETNSQ
jgi:hypothetical protein